MIDSIKIEIGGKEIIADSSVKYLEFVERRIAAEPDVIMMLAVVLTLVVLVLVLVQREDDVANGDEEEPLGIPALRVGNEEVVGYHPQSRA